MSRDGLSRADLDPNPRSQLERWLTDAIEGGLQEPTAMTLATADATGAPSARIVLLKSIDEDGLLFSTNYQSRKGRELAENPRAAIVLLWQPLHRQVRVEGAVDRAKSAESDAIFAARPRGARISAWSSSQSRPIPDRATLERAVRETEARFPGEIPRPEFWGAYRLRPETFEFWHGSRDRRHDRFRYTRKGADWSIVRLSP